MAREEHIELFAANVEGILAGGVADADAFVHLAVSGEQLRRAVRFARAGATRARRTLRRYDRYLAAHAGALPPDPGKQITAVLRDLRDYSGRAYRARDAEAGRRLLTELDEILCVGGAAWRTGRLGREKVDALAERARTRMRKVAPRLHDLWQHAEDAEVRFGPDPALPELFSFWEELARLAPSRLALAEALRMSP
ncbi:MAG: hypothetical protein QME96_18910, partial [Myxococcota bacterium]|nr:hypothetical protein [Myxococcota bacterium]